MWLVQEFFEQSSVWSVPCKKVSGGALDVDRDIVLDGESRNAKAVKQESFTAFVNLSEELNIYARTS